MIDLGLGNPDLRLLPLELIGYSAEAYFSGGDARPLQYGLEQGNGVFRGALAAFLAKAYGVPVDAELLLITAGASSALDLICTLFTRPGDLIIVEEPTYYLALRIFADHGLQPIPIPMDSEGLRVDLLDHKLSETRPKFIYTVPTFQNPSGRTLSAARRAQLVAWAQQRELFVLADEVYHLLPYGQSPPQPLAAFTAQHAQVISIGSFSKILAPGLRLGWVQAHASVIKRLASCGLLDSGGGMNPLMSALIHKLIASGGLAENIAALHAEYDSRRLALDAALHESLPAAQYELPQGGFFFWVRLPGVDTAALRPKAQRSLVDIRPGPLFSSQLGLGEYMRLSFSHYTARELEQGVQRLAKCCA
jgi:DNA-binding transcriptional MocR family regulator